MSLLLKSLPAAILMYCLFFTLNRRWQLFRISLLRREFYAIWRLLSPNERQSALSRAYGFSGELTLSADQSDGLVLAAIDLAWEAQQMTGNFDVTNLRREVFGILPPSYDLAS